MKQVIRLFSLAGVAVCLKSVPLNSQNMPTPSVHQPSEATHTLPASEQPAQRMSRFCLLCPLPPVSLSPACPWKSLPYDLASPSDAHGVAHRQKSGCRNPESCWGLCALPSGIGCQGGVGLPFTRYLGKALSVPLAMTLQVNKMKHTNQ